MLVGVGLEAEQLRHAAVEIAQRVGVGKLFLQSERDRVGSPARAAAEIARAVEREHGGFVERRREVGRGGVGRVMLHADDPGRGNISRSSRWISVPDLGPKGRTSAIVSTVDLSTPASRKRFGDRLLGHVSRRRVSGYLLLLDGGDQLAVQDDRTGRIPFQAADAENDHFPFAFCAFSILAQVSRSATVRLNTFVATLLSASTQK